MLDGDLWVCVISQWNEREREGREGDRERERERERKEIWSVRIRGG
jgi:hypothetical protein